VILGVLQARMTSTRLPGKVLMPVQGIPMIDRILERVARARSLDDVVVAIPDDARDDVLAEHLAARWARVFRGSRDDVLARFLGVADVYEPQTIVRLTADNPFTDPAVIDLIVAEHLASGSDYSSNAIVRTFPRGLDAEAVSVDALRRLDALGLDREEREHVTLGIYRRPEVFRLHEVVQGPDRSHLRWTVDLPEDLAWADAVSEELPEAAGQAELLALLERRPDLVRLESDVG
jgi:spore coat polysaccharide biosynthesis protein SpsF